MININMSKTQNSEYVNDLRMAAHIGTLSYPVKIGFVDVPSSVIVCNNRKEVLEWIAGFEGKRVLGANDA